MYHHDLCIRANEPQRGVGKSTTATNIALGIARLLAQVKKALGRIGVKARVFNQILRTASNGNQEKGDEMAEVFDDRIPVLSPAQGFRDDMAPVKVSLLERTKKNRLNTQPYLVTSSRELKRVTDQQIIDREGKEIALRVIDLPDRLGGDQRSDATL